MNEIPVIIPSYEPDDRLINLLRDFEKQSISPVIVVNDGSGAEYGGLFSEVKMIVARIGGTVIEYPDNHGKGYALKTAFNYVLNNYPDVIGVVTADSDGQHTIECIRKVESAFINNPEALVLGVREFEGEDIPWKSQFGNKLTIKTLALVSGLHISDTQTGLRGIPIDFMKTLINVSYDRFEFETQMLLDSVNKCPIVEVPIRTIYESKENHQTHFNPVKDSIRIYSIFAKRFLKYMFSSFSSCLIDLVIFSIFCYLFKGTYAYVAKATVLARIISATYNYGMNYKIVFNSDENVGKAAFKYFLLAIIQMSVSAELVSLFVWLIPKAPELLWKIIVDTTLFFISYFVQKRFVFTRRK